MGGKVDIYIMQVERVKEGYPNVIFIMVPDYFSADFSILQKKLEASPLNNMTYLPKWGHISRVLHFKGSTGIEIYSDDIQPISFSDWANILLNQLNQKMEDEESDLPSKIEDELIYFIGEFTMLRDGSL